MGKKFSVCFGAFEIREDLKRLFEDVTVERVSIKQDQLLARVYISYDRLITKDHIFALEKELDSAFFSAKGLSTRIIEDYHLNEQYLLIQNSQDSNEKKYQRLIPFYFLKALLYL